MTRYEDKLVRERYCVEGESTWEDVSKRIVDSICKTKSNRDVMYDYIVSKKFIPNSPTVMNAGTPSGQLSACFVLPVEDSIPSIFDAVKNAAIIHKTGGGTGFSFSSLRAEGSTVKSTNGVASGVVSFMEVFDAATNAIKQGGKRRGANMGVLEYTHPEIEKFITCKRTEGKIKNFNISVMVDDKFMKEIENAKPSDERTRNTAIFNDIVEGIWQNGEPGILFKDAINSANPNPELGDMVATNPCGEQPLLPNESCNLGSINLSEFVTTDGKIDFFGLKEVTYAAVEFLDAVIDANKYPLPQIEEATKRTRKIGLGVMGFHDMLLKLKIPYDDERAFGIAERIMGYINHDAYVASVKINDGNTPKNSTRTTIAPTGTISIIAGVSSGIEPVFSWAYTRKDTTGERIVVHPQFDSELRAICEKEGDMNLYNDVIRHVMETGTIQDIKWLSEDFKKLFRGAMDISYKEHICMQAMFQKYVNNAVSKTINMPQEATREDIAKAIVLAWKNRCKGMTIYRSGSREEEVLCLTKKPDVVTINSFAPLNEVLQTTDNIIDWVEDEFYESVTSAYIYKVRSGCGKFYVIVGHDGESPTKVFVEGDGTGGCAANMAALGRSVSTGLDCGVSAESYVKQFGRVKCNTAMNNKSAGGKSCADIIGKSVNDVINRLDCIKQQEYTAPVLTASNKTPAEPKIASKQCCDNPKFVMQEGCQVCLNCGQSKCS